MSETLQWLLCGLIGAIALFYLLRSAGVLGGRAAACGHCAKCSAAGRIAMALKQMDREKQEQS
jgi:hypothetical protein